MTHHQENPPHGGRNLRPGATVGLIALMAAGTLALLPLMPTSSPDGPFKLTLWMVVALSAATELASVHRHGDGQTHTLSMSEITLVIGLAFADPGVLVLGRALAGLLVYGAYRRLPVLKTGFNTVLFALETAAAAVCFHAVLGTALPVDPMGWLALSVGVAAATLAGLGAVMAVLALHGARGAAGDGLSTTLLSLGMTGLGAAIGILAVGALWQHTAAFAFVGIASGLIYAGLRVITDQAANLHRIGSLDDSLGSLTDPMVTASLAVESMCRLLRVDGAEAVIEGEESLHRICARDGAGTDHADVSPTRWDFLLGSLGDEALSWGRRIPQPIRLELESRGFRDPVVVLLCDEGGPFGYLAAGGKRPPERRLSRADRQVLVAAARHLERVRRGAVLA